MPGIDFRRLRAIVSMADVLQLIQFEPCSKRSNQWRGACPIHEPEPDKSMVFSANVAKNVFRCFKCGAAGNQLDLWAIITKQPLFEASLELCRRLQLEAPSLPGTEKRNA
jgi:DNA primase